jgi:hypothetical protein
MIESANRRITPDHVKTFKERENYMQTNDFSLNKKLQSLDRIELYELLQILMNKKPELHKLILEWFKAKQNSGESGTDEDMVSLNERLLSEHWNDAKHIISEFNEYGGCGYEDENEAYDSLYEISELIEEGNISSSAKLEFLDDAFKEYNIGNSGFEDALMDIFFSICETKEEWEYLVTKLDEKPSGWRKKLIMDIQKNCFCDDEAYLEERMKILHYGMDYWDLVTFYIDRNKPQKSLEIAEEGILKGEGRVIELFQFLFDHFAAKKDTYNLKRIVNTALERKTEEKSMLDRLFKYYEDQNDYENAKENLLQSFDFTPQESHYAEYKKIKKFLKDSDWKQVEPEIFNKTKEKNIHDYLRICMDKNMEKTVLDVIFNPPVNRWGIIINNNFDEFADRLIEKYPEKIIEYYWQRARKNIPGGNRKTYAIAAGYLAKAKHIYIKTSNDESTWKKRFFDLRTEFKNRPAFLDETNML